MTRPTEDAALGVLGADATRTRTHRGPKADVTQVKQMDKCGRPDIDAFETVMAREERQRGLFVFFAFSSDAEQECEAFRKKTGRLIKLVTVQDILDERLAKKM